MNYLYHIIPPNLEGDTLHPFNELKLHKPHIYQKAVQNFFPFDSNLLSQYQEIPPPTLAHYRKAISHKTPLFLYVTVPHILHKGSLGISKLEVIEVI